MCEPGDVFLARKQWLEERALIEAKPAEVFERVVNTVCPCCGRWVFARVVEDDALKCHHCGDVWYEGAA